MFFDPAIAYMSAAIDLHATKTTLGLLTCKSLTLWLMKATVFSIVFSYDPR